MSAEYRRRLASLDSPAMRQNSSSWDDPWARYQSGNSAEVRWVRARHNRDPFVYQLGHGPDCEQSGVDEDEQFSMREDAIEFITRPRDDHIPGVEDPEGVIRWLESHPDERIRRYSRHVRYSIEHYGVRKDRAVERLLGT